MIGKRRKRRRKTGIETKREAGLGATISQVQLLRKSQGRRFEEMKEELRTEDKTTGKGRSREETKGGKIGGQIEKSSIGRKRREVPAQQKQSLTRRNEPEN